MMILYRVHPRAEKDTLVAADAAQRLKLGR
jgi:hypothetical protein